MHKPTMEGLEDYLSGRETAGRARLMKHLGGCAECSSLVEAMKLQSGMVRTLRPGVEVDPAPGFYARVMERVEAQTTGGLWAVFFEPFFVRGFMYASAALLIVLGTAAVAIDTTPGLHAAVPVEMVAEAPMPDAASENAREDRNVVFVNLASYGTTASTVPLLPTMND